LRWKGIEAATTEVVTGKPGVVGGEPAIVVYSESRTSELAAIFKEVTEQLTTTISLETGRPLRAEAMTVEDGQRSALDVIFDPSGSSYHSKFRDDEKRTNWIQKGEVAELHSFLARLRAWDGAPAAGTVLFVQDGRSYYRVLLKRGKGKTLTLGTESIPAVRIYGSATRLRTDGKERAHSDPRDFVFWRSDDGRFLPLLFEVDTRVGRVYGTLSDYRQGDSSRCLRVRSKL